MNPNFKKKHGLNANMMQAGEGWITYPKFTYFSVDEVQKLIGVQVSHGLSPIPQVSMKFKSQVQDPINRNDFIASVM